LPDSEGAVRQIAVSSLGREEPTLFLTNVSVHRCSCKFCSDLCARAGAFANGRPLVFQTTVPGSYPLRAA
jgi:hypothetical protein